MRILLLSLGILFASELEVEGDLKVTGNIDAQNNPIKNVGIPTDMNDAVNAQILQDALRDDGPFEYKYYGVRFSYPFNGNTNVGYESEFVIHWKEWGDEMNGITGDWESHLGTLSQEGWEISNTYSQTTSSTYPTVNILYELKRKLED